MPRGTLLKLLGKAGAFVSSNLRARELGVDTATKRLAFSTDGADVIYVPDGADVLVWDGASYPTKRARFALYVGPVNPETLLGPLPQGDEWRNTGAALDANAEQTVILGANVANATTVFADVTGLGMSLKAGVTYEFRFFIHFNSSIATANSSGTKWGLNGPAFSFMTYRSQWTTLQNSQSVFNSDQYNVGTPGNNNAQLTGNSVNIEGTITPSADGILIPRFAANNSSQTVTALARSRGTFRALP